MSGILGQKILCAIGLISLLHTAYSAAQHRSYLRLTEQEFTSLPLDISIQCLISLALVCYSATNIAGQFQPIRATAEMQKKSADSVLNCPSFYTFEHRGKTVSPYFAAVTTATTATVASEED